MDLDGHGACKYVGRFKRMIVDEAHHLKDMATRAHKTLVTMKAPRIWLMTETRLEKAPDLMGYLNLLWNKQWEGDFILNAPENPTLDDVQARQDCYSKLSRNKQPAPLHMLNPGWYASFIKDCDITSEAALAILPTILRRLCLKCTIDDTVTCIDGKGKEVSKPIGNAIPSYDIETIQLKLSADLQKEHDDSYDTLIEGLKGGGVKAESMDSFSDEDPVERLKFRTQHRLNYLAFSPLLERLAKKTETRNLSLDIWSWDDNGGAFLITRTKRDGGMLPPTDPIAISHYIGFYTPKLCYFAISAKSWPMYACRATNVFWSFLTG